MENGYYWAKYTFWGLHVTHPEIVLVERDRVYRHGDEKPYALSSFAWGPVEFKEQGFASVNFEEL